MGAAHGPLELVHPQSFGWDHSDVSCVAVPPGKPQPAAPPAQPVLAHPPSPLLACVLSNELPALESVTELAFGRTQNKTPGVHP